MSVLINAQNLQKSFATECLFSQISFSISEKERIGLIGPNGSGKSTLLKILAGLEDLDAGRVAQNSQARVVYLAQEDQFTQAQSVGDVLQQTLGRTVLEGEYPQRIWEVTKENIFNDLTQPVASLSGGWRKRLSLVRALVQKPDLLLLDEPTNHLDLDGILWLEQILKEATFAFVMVTHDRAFLENTVNSIMELNRIYLDGYFKTVGNYSQFLQRRDDFIAAQMQKEQSLANKLRREEEWLQRMPKARTTKAQYRIDQAVELKQELNKLSTHNAKNKTAVIDFVATERKTKILLEADQLTLTRNNKTLFSNLSFKLSPGNCLGLLGKNGSGKSSLIQLLTGAIQPDSGSIKYADNLRMVTFDQKREQLDQNQTLMQALAPSGEYVQYKDNSIHVASWAKRFLFASEQLRQPVSRLSGGEQARLLIANLMLQPADILFLDEPTNDLDIATLEVLEESLCDFPGAIVLITHDRFLLDRLSDRLLYLTGDARAAAAEKCQGGWEFFADYAQWRAFMATPTVRKLSIKTMPKAEPIKKLSYDEQRELGRIPAKIEKAEAELDTLQAQLNQPEVQSDAAQLIELCTKIQTTRDKINQLYQRWEQLEILN